jgi:hypothetical protein
MMNRREVCSGTNSSIRRYWRPRMTFVPGVSDVDSPQQVARQALYKQSLHLRTRNRLCQFFANVIEVILLLSVCLVPSYMQYVAGWSKRVHGESDTAVLHNTRGRRASTLNAERVLIVHVMPRVIHLGLLRMLASLRNTEVDV